MLRFLTASRLALNSNLIFEMGSNLILGPIEDLENSFSQTHSKIERFKGSRTPGFKGSREKILEQINIDKIYTLEDAFL
jgi:hypothetical protein